MDLLYRLLLAVVSFFLPQKHLLHSLSTKRVSLRTLSIHELTCSGSSHDGTYPFTFTCSDIRLQFHWPDSTSRHWLKFTCTTPYYTSPTAQTSAASIVATCWFFPLLFRQTAGPWADVEIDDLRIRVRKSKETPYFIQGLRRNIVGAVLTGEIIRVDDFKTTVKLSGLVRPVVDEDNDEADGDDGGSKDLIMSTVPSTHHSLHPEPFSMPSSFQDELRVSVYARQLHLHNHEGRVYTFGDVQSQFRRNWTERRGTLVLVSKECRWTRAHWSVLEKESVVIGWWTQLVTSVVKFPSDIMLAINNPMTIANLYVSTSDVRFDEFRIRDAELLIQAITIAREKMYHAGVEWQDVLIDGLAGMLRQQG
ncbi:hypothetical protein BXZ70DRAFT_941116 [Cristinia sonorae]|uniref:Uncharacterized protein n=1 Tax=Cristinia sonorae TaxID=1940300 RepID=A0A8K0UMR9_9AGAR|nr:hypothetical protein BXZ70DRAFT_941116 [Cristinia sonorae]